MSQIDFLVRRILLTKFFTKGWGQPDNLKRIFNFRKILSDREQCQHLVQPDYPIYIDKEEIQKECRIIQGHFLSPFTQHLPGIMPKEVENARFEMILPKQWTGPLKPICVHLAGTGDHKFGRRRVLLARPLLKEYGIASIILENPYYGYRKPKAQFRSSLLNVSDLFVMGGALVMESLALFHWCESQGFGPLGITGISMGGHMASLAASNWHKPISLIPCLSWSTASSVFTQGVMSNALNWNLLSKQYKEEKTYKKEVEKLIVSPERQQKESLISLGKSFSKHFEQYDSIKSPSIEKKIDLKITNESKVGDEKSFAEYYFGDIVKQFLRISEKTDLDSIKEDAVYFMQGVMDECTHLGNFSVPLDPSLIIIVCANRDAYIPRGTVLNLHEIWPGAELREVDRGHVTAFLFEQSSFRKAIFDSFTRQIEKYYSTSADAEKISISDVNKVIIPRR